MPSQMDFVKWCTAKDVTHRVGDADSRACQVVCSLADPRAAGPYVYYGCRFKCPLCQMTLLVEEEITITEVEDEVGDDA